MDIRKRLLRRPLTTVLWTILVTVMALMLSVGCALMYSSGSLAGILDQYHTSIAVNTDRAAYEEETEWGLMWKHEDRNLYQEDVDYLMSLDSVKDVYFQTLTGGYSPSFDPIIAPDRYSYDNETYYHAMVAGKVTKIYRITEIGYPGDLTAFGLSDAEPYYECYMEIEVEDLVLHNCSFMDEEKVTHMNIDIQLAGQEAVEYFREGERYLFFGECDPSTSLHVENLRPLNWLRFRYGDAVMDGQLYRIALDYFPGAIHPYVPDRPEVAKLEDTVEEFLADPQNAEWARMADSWDKLQHSLPVIGTEDLEAMYAFVTKSANLAEGRFITQEEYDTGARVCMLSTTLAERSGIAVGDTISLSQFLCGNPGWSTERNASLTYTSDGMMNNPTAGAYVADLEFVTENEEFTVVGLYRCSNEWENTSYSFTPNTVFIPKTAQVEGAFGGPSQVRTMEAVTGEDGKEYTWSYQDDGATNGIYLTILLENGKVSQFKAAMEDSKFAGWFLTADQGFEKVLVGLQAISGSARKLMGAVSIGWLLLVALYLLLYQGSQRRNLGIMRSQGASPAAARNYLFGSGMALAAVGIWVGTAASMAVIGYVQRSLVTSAFGQAVLEGGTSLSQEVLEAMLIQSQLPGWMLAVIGTAQLVIFALMLWTQAALIAKRPPRKLLGK